MAEALTKEQLSAIIAQQIAQARDHDRRERVGTRTKALEYYQGTMKDTPAEVNRSSVVSRDVADTIGWMLPGLMRVFTGSDKFVEAEPIGPEDIDGAHQATDGLNHVFWKDNAGYEICYAATWDALLFGDGVIKTYWDDTPQYSVSFHSGLSEDQLAYLLMAEDGEEAPEVLAQTERMEMAQDEMGNLAEVPVYDVKIQRLRAKGRFVIECIPPEDFLNHRDATNIDDSPFVAHLSEKMRSELIEMGYDPEDVASLPEIGASQSSEEAAREYDGYGAEQAPDSSTELVEYAECYVRIDVDGDGVAELVRACFGGGDAGTLLHWEVWEDENPFDNIPCEPMPHRYGARSIFDETQDVQRVKTVLTRQALNNIYAANNPQRHVKGKISNPEELSTPSFNGAVFGDANSEIVPLTIPFVANHAFEAIAYQDEVIQRRTGVGRSSMALDPEALQNQTATANQNQRDAAYSQVEIVARNMAEFGWRKVFRKLMKLMIRHQDRPRTIRLRGEEFVEIDPRHWNADMDITINVGLGTGSRDRDMMMLQSVQMDQLGLADRFVALGAMDQAIDMLPKVVETMTRKAEAAGLKNPDTYYPDAGEDIVQMLKQKAAEAAQQPDPKVQQEQAKLEMQAASDASKLQLQAQTDAAKLQQDAANTQAEMQLRREQMGMEFQLKREQLQAELNLKREQMYAELALQRELGQMKAAVKASTATTGTSDVRMGGEPG